MPFIGLFIFLALLIVVYIAKHNWDLRKHEGTAERETEALRSAVNVQNINETNQALKDKLTGKQ